MNRRSQVTSRTSCRALALAIAPAALLALAGTTAAQDCRGAGPIMHNMSYRYTCKPKIVKGAIEEKILSQRTEVIDRVDIPCPNTFGTTALISQQVTTGVSGTVTVTGGLSATVSAEAGIGAIGKVGGSVTQSIEISASGMFSTQTATTVQCQWTVPECRSFSGEMRQKVKEFETSQTFTECLECTCTASDMPSQIGEVFYLGPVKNATAKVTGLVRSAKECAETAAGRCECGGNRAPNEEPTPGGHAPDGDHDGVPDADEPLRGTDPNDADTDNDQMGDASDPCPTSADCDFDGLSDGEEILAIGTDPLLADTDGDGEPDALDLFPTVAPNPTNIFGAGLPSGLVVGGGVSGTQFCVSGSLTHAPTILLMEVRSFSGQASLHAAAASQGQFAFRGVDVGPGPVQLLFYGRPAISHNSSEVFLGATSLFIQPAGPRDSDHDGVSDDCDRCPGHPDGIDTDGDGIPDGCDPSCDAATCIGACAMTDGSCSVMAAADCASFGGTFQGLATSCTCPADFNQDGNIDPDDLGDYINCYFAVPPCNRADFNNDGNVDPDDLGDYLNVFFGAPC